MTPTSTFWDEFFAMGGYVFPVRLAVMVIVVPPVVLIVHSVMQHRAILHGAAQQWARGAHLRTAQQQEAV